MSNRPTPLERAFALARSGTCANLTDIRQKMQAEGYPLAQLDGPVLLRQLRDLCAENRPQPDTPPG